MKFLLTVLSLAICIHQTFAVITLPQSENANMRSLLYKIEKEKRFQTLVVYAETKRKQDFCMSDEDLKKVTHTQLLLQVKHLLLHEAATLEKQAINKQMLIVCCIAESYEQYLLQRILQHLGRLRSTRFIFYWTQSYVESMHKQQLQLLFEACQQNFLLNVIAVFENFASTRTIYTYTQFPHFRVFTNTLQAPTFPNRLSNLQNATIRTTIFSSIPAIIVYKDVLNGSTNALGYVASVVKAFAQKHNAHLKFLTEPQFSFNLSVLSKLRNGSADLAIALLNKPMKDVQCSNILETISVMLMFPYPKRRPVADIFVLIFKTHFTLLVVLLLLAFACMFALEEALQHAACSILKLLQAICALTLTTILRAILAQTMHFTLQARLLHKSLYILLIFLGIYTSTTITAYLQAYLTSLPLEMRITTFEELLVSTMKIVVPSPVHQFMHKFYGEHFFGKYEQTFDFQPLAGQDWQYMHNLSFARLTTSAMWRIWERKQERLARQLFYLSDELYITKNLPNGIPLPLHSIYFEALNTLLSQVQQSGLLQHWQRLSYDDMIAAGIMTRDVVDAEEQLHILELSDLYWITWAWAFGIGLAILAFVVEVILGRLQRLL